MCHRKLLFILTFKTQNEFYIFEARNWCSIWSSCKSKKLSSLIVIKIIKDYIPEPFYKLMIRFKWSDIFGHFLKFSEVESFGSAYELLKLFRSIEIREHLFIKESVETTLKGIDLCLALFFKAEVDVQINKFISVFFCYHNFCSSWF